ncbi:MAG: TetR family transcriptional regulator C-terminal domain-containing protein [Paracoccaceae bacterium]|nr:TetR family transcriptional regulator C-terminal domain-containing protein [Paracoccaceae bacterium]
MNIRVETKPRSKNKVKRRTAPKEVRRSQLIEATIDCIAERGITGTTMAAVTGRAGLSMGIVSLHFESKDNLLKATLTHLSQEVRSTWADKHSDETMTSAQKLWAVAMSSFDPHIFNPKKVAVWFAFFGDARYRAFYRQIVESFDDERGDVLAALCESVAPEGQDFDAVGMTDMIESLGDGLWLNALLYPETFTREYCMEQMGALLIAEFPKHYGRPQGADA